jgi:C4-dicarboxylate-specific signal transduction histidine kinase
MKIRTACEGNELKIVLSHGGIALHPETVKAVISESFSATGQGSGLGLALCARILEEHGANLEIKGSEQTGTSFIIRMQIAKEESYGPSVGG